MEFFYCISTILFFTLGISIVAFLFRKNKSPTTRKESWFRKLIRTIFGGSGPAPAPTPRENKYDLIYADEDSYNDVLRCTALNVTITNIDKPGIKTSAVIFEDDKLAKTGVTVGQQQCDYNMQCCYLDKQRATFLIRRTETGFDIIGEKNSVNGIKKNFGYNHQREKHIAFANGATCYVGPIRFDFSVPNYACATTPEQKDDEEQNKFYNPDTFNVPLS